MLKSEALWWTQLNRVLRGHKSLPISSFSGTALLLVYWRAALQLTALKFRLILLLLF